MIQAHKCNSLEEFVNHRVYVDRFIAIPMMKAVLKSLEIKHKSSARWMELFNLIKDNEVDGMEFYKLFPSAFCVIKSDYVERFNLTDREYNYLKKNKILKEVAELQSSYSSSKSMCGFCVEQFFSVTEEELKAAVPQQDLEKVEKMKQARVKSLTCVRCNEVQRHHSYINKDKLCSVCEEKEREAKRIKLCSEQCKEFLNSENYVILDTETTGLNSWDEVIELAIIDMKGNTLYESLFNPSESIPEESTNVHGITNEMVKDSPSFIEEWETIFGILKDKTVLIYNARFDVNMIYQTLDKSEILCEDTFKSFCIMEFFKNYIGSTRWVKLSYACDMMNIEIEQDHRATGDCKMVLDLIKAIANKN